jgi:hypothetical protein
MHPGHAEGLFFHTIHTGLGQHGYPHESQKLTIDKDLYEVQAMQRA